MNLYSRIKSYFQHKTGILKMAAAEAASGGRRALALFKNASSDDVNSNFLMSGEVLRDRSRAAVRDNAWAAAAVESYTANAIGTGIKPDCQIDDPELRQQVQLEWTEWCQNADFDNRTDFYGLEALVFRSMLESGEVLGKLIITDPAVDRIPLRVQVLEADHLPFTIFGKINNVPEGHKVEFGTEFDADMRIVAYHLYKKHPGANYIPPSSDLVRVPEADICHIYQTKRPGQRRGIPHLTPVLVAIAELDQYMDAALLRKKVATMFAGIITKNSPDDVVLPQSERNSEDNSIAELKLEPGTLLSLLPGESITFPTIPDVVGDDVLIKAWLRKIAVGCGLTYDRISGDHSDANYSSLRSALLEFRRKCEMLQNYVMAIQFCRKVYQRWFQVAVTAGVFKVPAGKYEQYKRVNWITPGWPWVDPVKDLTAATISVRGGFSSRRMEVAERGDDVERVDQQTAEDNSRADEQKLSYDSDGRRPENTPLLEKAADASGEKKKKGAA